MVIIYKLNGRSDGTDRSYTYSQWDGKFKFRYGGLDEAASLKSGNLN